MLMILGFLLVDACKKWKLKTYFPQWWFFMVMNDMVETEKKTQTAKKNNPSTQHI